MEIADLKDWTIRSNLKGFGLCGYGGLSGGFVYSSECLGNTEVFVSKEEIFKILEEDQMTIKTVEITLNSKMEITYIRIDVIPILNK